MPSAKYILKQIRQAEKQMEPEITAKKWHEERKKAEMEVKAWMDQRNEEYLKFMGGQ